MINKIIEFNPSQLIKEEWINKKEAALASALEIKVVNSDDDLKISGALQTGINKLIKSLGRERLNCTRPIDDLKKEITNLEKGEVKELTTELNRLKSLNNIYATKIMREQQEARRIAEEKAQAEASKLAAEQMELKKQAQDIFGEEAEFIPQPVEVPVALPKIEKPKTTANKFIKVWSCEIMDSALIPRQFLIVDESKIRAYVKMQKDQAVIPGVRTWEEVSVQSK